MSNIESAHAAFAQYYRKEHHRSERALNDILEILVKLPDDEAIGQILERLERHWGRYGEPGSLQPVSEALAGLPAGALVSSDL